MKAIGFLSYRIYPNGSIENKHGTKLKLHTGAHGYLNANLYLGGKQKTYLLHRLVAGLFIPNPNNLPEVNHIDGNKMNNDVSNLEWCTRSYNIKHGIENGLITVHMKGKSGNKHHRSKTVEQIDDGGNVIAEWGSAREAARETGINYGTISNVLINRGKTAGGYKWGYKQ